MPEVLKSIANILVVVLGASVVIVSVWILNIITGYRLTCEEEDALKKVRDQKKNPPYFLKKASS